MSDLKRKNLFHIIIVAIFSVTCFTYLLVFNRYHIIFQEQSQLFIFSWDYFTGYLNNPGGLSSYVGAFFTQFFINYFAGGLILTIAGVIVYLLTAYILRKGNLNGVLFSLIPGLILLAVGNDYTYTFGYTVGLILALALTAIYFSIRKDTIRFSAGFIGLFLLYMASGGFMILAAILCLIHEFMKRRYRLPVVSGYLIVMILFPYIAGKFIYYIPPASEWTIQILLPFAGITRILSLSLLIYYPLTLIIAGLWMALSHKSQINFKWSWSSVIPGTVIYIFLSWGIIKYSYDDKTESLFKMDYYVQHSEWRKALEHASTYPGTNRLIIYFTNLSLYKTGQMGDSLFHFNHIGKDDLWLEWPGGKLSLFFGAEIFYHLGYFNETYRRAYDAMVLTGQNPRSLKCLAKISLVNGNNGLVEKHLKILDQTLFYRKWSQHYKSFLQDPDLMQEDQEIMEKSHLLLNSDFLVDTNNPDQTLFQLVKHHPENRMAYEYLLASFLLDKNLTAFVSYISNLKSYGFKDLPVHYEEALLVYMNQTQKNIVPEGYMIRESTNKGFEDYYNDYSNARSSYSGNLNLMAERLYKNYGKTYWFYLHFINNKVNIR